MSGWLITLQLADGTVHSYQSRKLTEREAIKEAVQANILRGVLPRLVDSVELTDKKL